ncbi:MAG TPA: recombinase family protein, partial [Candidatus Saccharimonadales bacterium]|nr:recombinase family protein [Candidatus Saccharimonadales bacterium]
YFITDDNRLVPDGNNFLIIKEAFEMRCQKKSQAEIVRYLNNRKEYTYRRRDQGPRSFTWSKDTIADLLTDPAYAGVLRYGKHIVDLTKIYDFEPAVTAAKFLEINKAKDFLSPTLKSAFSVRDKEDQITLLNGMVLCASCGKRMTAGITIKSSGDSYFRFRCETRTCEFRNKGPRASILTDFAIEQLDCYRFTTKNNYENYVDNMKEVTSNRHRELMSTINGLNKTIGFKRKEFENAKRIAADTNNKLQKYYINDIESLNDEIISLEKQRQEVMQEKDTIKDAIMTYEKYLELFENVADLLRSNKSIETLDVILRKFYSNFTVKAELIGPKYVNSRWEVIDFNFQEPFSQFIKHEDFDSGRGERT